MSMTPNKDVFGMSSVQESSSGVPPIQLSQVKTMGRDLSKYNVRVERFIIDSELDDLNGLESLLSRCLNPKDESAWLLERKDNFNKDGAFTSILFYLEKKPE